MCCEEVFVNVLLMFLCYVYILFIIFVSSKMDKLLHVSKKTSGKFLHMMIGNFPFIIPFFISDTCPVLVATPFILVMFFTSPYSLLKNISRRLKGLADITEKGNHLGLFFAVSYTFLALLSSSKPCVIAACILPMAYGDSIASIVGERFGRRRYKLVADKSLEELRRTRHKELSLASIGKWTIVDANKPVRDVEKDIQNHLVKELFRT